MRESTFFNHEEETYTREELRAIQQRRLVSIVRHTGVHNRFFARRYREAGIDLGTFRGLEDLERLRRVFGGLRLVDGAEVASSLGDARLVNTVLLGALSAHLPLAASCWEAAFRRIVRPQLLEANLRAFASGRGD